MKKILLHTIAIIVLMMGAAAVYAQMPAEQGGGQQWGHGQPPTAEQRLQRMTKMLNLSSDQQQKIKPILENESSQMESLRADSSLTQQERMAKMQQLRQASSEQIKPILNPEQLQTYSEMMSHQGHRGGPNQNQAPPQPQ